MPPSALETSPGKERCGKCSLLGSCVQPVNGEHWSWCQQRKFTHLCLWLNQIQQIQDSIRTRNFKWMKCHVSMITKLCDYTGRQVEISVVLHLSLVVEAAMLKVSLVASFVAWHCDTPRSIMHFWIASDRPVTAVYVPQFNTVRRIEKVTVR